MNASYRADANARLILDVNARFCNHERHSHNLLLCVRDTRALRSARMPHAAEKVLMHWWPQRGPSSNTHHDDPQQGAHHVVFQVCRGPPLWRERGLDSEGSALGSGALQLRDPVCGFPGELWTTKVTIGGRVSIDRPEHIEALNNGCWTHIEDVLNGLADLFVRNC